MAQQHASATNAVLLDLKEDGVLAWRNPTGMAFRRKPGGGFAALAFGLPGSPDIIGIKPRKITEADVGKTLGIFVGVEVKVGRDTVKQKQKLFGEAITSRGGIYQVKRVEKDV